MHPGQTLTTSGAPSVPALPSASTKPDSERLITWLHGMMLGWYGAKFSDQWAGVPEAVFVRTWAKGVEGYSREEIKAGVAACKSLKWPPTLPEFLMLCRPPVNYERAYLEAQEQMGRREARSGDTWSSPAIFWAAGSLGPDLKNVPYRNLEQRWRYALDMALEDVASGRRGEVPEPAVAIEYQHKAAPMPEEVRAMLRGLHKKLTAKAAEE